MNASKGLEFPVVAGGGNAEGLQEEEMRDETRLVDVAATGATDFLIKLNE